MRTRRAAALALFFACVFLASACSDTVSREPSPGDAAVKGIPLPSPYTDKPLYMIGTRPVTREELKRYSARMLGGRGAGKHGSFSPERVITDFSRFWVVVRRGFEMKVHESKVVRDVVDVYRRTALTQDFRDQLRKTLTPPPERMAALVHDEWVRIDFSIVTFPTMDGAKKFRGGIGKKKNRLSPDEFDRFVEENFKNSTGPVFRNSGFFESYDEFHLFSLKEGEFSDPVRTGIGPGVCYVRSRQDMDESAIEKYIEAERGKIVEAMISDRFLEIIEGASYEAPRDKLDEAVRIEAQTGDHSDIVVLTLPAKDREVVVRYRDVRSMKPTNFVPYFRQYPPESWADFAFSDVKAIADFFAIGGEAMREGVTLNDQWEKEIYDFTLKTVYLETLEGMMEEADIELEDGAVESFYNKNKGFFAHDLTLDVAYVYAPQQEALRSLLKEAGSKAEIFTKGEYSNLVKVRSIWKGDLTHRRLFENVRGYKEGSISDVIRGDMGFYIVRIDERKEKGFIPLEEARESIEKHLTRAAKRKKVEEDIQERLKTMEARKI